MVSEAFPDVTLIDAGGNLGFAGANNLAIARSTSEYVLLLNSDTVLVDDVVGPLLRVLERDERIAIAGPRLVYPDGRDPGVERDVPDAAVRARPRPPAEQALAAPPARGRPGGPAVVGPGAESRTG